MYIGFGFVIEHMKKRPASTSRGEVVIEEVMEERSKRDHVSPRGTVVNARSIRHTP